MPVSVKRPKATTPPPTQIVAGAGPDASWNGNAVVFKAVKSYEGYRPSLEVCTRLAPDTYSPGRQGGLAHLYVEDARQLAAALVEWADAVDAS